MKLSSVELFAGGGGLALGTALSGFGAVAALEWDGPACDTLEKNRDAGFRLLRDVQVIRGDVRDFDFSKIRGPMDLVSGGPPCQPFSAGGKGRGYTDDRDMFNAYANAVASLRPRAFIIENVKGLTRPAFADYLAYIQLRMSMPDVKPRSGELWPDHLLRLMREDVTARDAGVRYNVTRRMYDAADFGVPQRRERVFIIGIRDDVIPGWAFPEPTHSSDALLWEQWVTGSYWDRHEVPTRDRPVPQDSAIRRINALRSKGVPPALRPWLTVRDALVGLPEPRPDGGDNGVPNHRYQSGARPYPGHTGSPIDLPSKALKAGAHGVPGGENMLVRVDGSVRYFTAREAARVQTFPDDYVFYGAWGRIMKQLGNAVPVRLAQVISGSVSGHLRHDSQVRARS